MKKLLVSFAALALLAACSKDDDGNDVKQPELLAKKITKIEEVGEYTKEFTYNKEGKIETINSSKVTYGTKEVKYDGVTYTLEDGRTVKSVVEDDDAFEYSYKDGYLTQCVWTQGSDEEKYAYTFKSGNLTQHIWSEKYEEDGKTEEDSETYDITYGKQSNNMNLDLLDIILGIYPNDASLLGIAGNRSVNLPEKAVCTYTYIDEDTGKEVKCEDIYTFTYKTDAEGYITEINTTYTGKENGKEVDNRTSKYVITYEK